MGTATCELVYINCRGGETASQRVAAGVTQATFTGRPYLEAPSTNAHKQDNHPNRLKEGVLVEIDDAQGNSKNGYKTRRQQRAQAYIRAAESTLHASFSPTTI